MTNRHPIWTERITLAVNGFNPVPYRTDSGLTVLYRRHHGTYATPYAQDYGRALATEYQIHPACEDTRPVPGTNPRLIVGAIYSNTTRQAALWTAETHGKITCLHRPQTLFIPSGRTRLSGKPEKNWLIWSHSPHRLRAIYHVCPYALAEPAADYNAWQITHRHDWPAPKWTRNLSRHLRGSTPPVTMGNGRLLVLWHFRAVDGGYWTGATIHGPDWPHNPEAATAEPLLTPNDATRVSPLWPPNTCIFPMFLELAPSGLATLWAGDSDQSSIVLLAPLDNLLRTMEPIP